MTNFIPIFPLSIIVYPGEAVNLHIFEERYIQLINEGVSEKKMFGIPSVINDRLNETGTLIEIKKVVKRYEDRKMDIYVEGIRIFRTLELIKAIPEKLYSGAIVTYPENVVAVNGLLMPHIIEALKELHRLLNINKKFTKHNGELLSYDIAHHAGLSLEEEYELLLLLREDHRLEYLKRHLNKILPIVAGTEMLKEKIKLNGHFKELKGFNLDL